MDDLDARPSSFIDVKKELPLQAAHKRPAEDECSSSDDTSPSPSPSPEKKVRKVDIKKFCSKSSTQESEVQKPVIKTALEKEVVQKITARKPGVIKKTSRKGIPFKVPPPSPQVKTKTKSQKKAKKSSKAVTQFSKTVMNEDKNKKNLSEAKCLPFIHSNKSRPVAEEAVVNKENLMIQSKMSKAQVVDDNKLLQASSEDKSVYVNTFLAIIDTVQANEIDWTLLNGSDANYLTLFKDLNMSEKEIYVRLYGRKYQWLPMEKIAYPNLTGELAVLLKGLHQKGFLDCTLDSNNKTTEGLSVEDLLDVLSLEKAKILSKYLNVKLSSKTEIIKFVTKLCANKKSFIFDRSCEEKIKGKINNLLGPCYRVNQDVKRSFERCFLVFDVAGGNESTLKILLASMKQKVYPSYEVFVTKQIFQSREELLAYESGYKTLEEIHTAFDKSKFRVAMELCEKAYSHVSTSIKVETEAFVNLPRFVQRYTSTCVYMRIKAFHFKILQKLRDYKRACDILRELLNQDLLTSKRGLWYEKLAVNLELYLKEPTKAVACIKMGLNDPLVTPDFYISLSERLAKLKNTQIQTPITLCGSKTTLLEASQTTIRGRYLPKRLQSSKARFMKRIEDNGDIILCSVEELAIDYYKGIGFDKGLHHEGSTFFTLFCIFMWDIVFMKVADVFRNKYQTLPLDFFTKDFYLTRKPEIDERLNHLEKWISNEFNSANHIREIWEANHDVSCGSMKWGLFSSPESVIELVSGLGSKVLAAIFRRIAMEPGTMKRGLPDLVLWQSGTPKAKIVEVKAPGDKLSASQKVWIHFLLSFGADVEVCHVVATNSSRQT